MITKWIFLLASPFIMFVLLAPDITISIVFGNRYLAGVFPLIILFLTYGIRVSLGPAGGSVIMLGKTKQLMYIVAFMAVTNIALNWFLIPLYGINGAAIATGVSIGLLSFLELGYLYRISKIQPIKITYIKMIIIFLSLMMAIYVVFYYFSITFSPTIKVLIIVFSYLMFLVLLAVFNLRRGGHVDY